MIEYLVNATEFERRTLWKNHSNDVVWEDEPAGYATRIGWCAGAPMAVSMSFAKINGCRIGFWDAISLVVDFAKVDAWLQSQYGVGTPMCDAMNFHLCLQHCIRHHP